MIVTEIDLKSIIISERVKSIVNRHINYENKDEDPMLRELTKKIKLWVIASQKYIQWDKFTEIVIDEEGKFKFSIKLLNETNENKIDVIFSNDFKTLSYRLYNKIPLDEVTDNPDRNLGSSDELHKIFKSQTRLTLLSENNILRDFCFPEIRYTRTFLSDRDIYYNDRLEYILNKFSDKECLIITDKYNEVDNLNLDDYKNYKIEIVKGK